MNTFTKRFILFAAIFALFAAVPMVRAEEDSENEQETEQREEKKEREEREERANKAYSKLKGSTEKKLEKCAEVEKKISERLNEDKRLEGKHRMQYAKIVARVDDLLTKAAAAGYDTTELDAQQKELKALVATFETDKAAYIAALKESQTASCAKVEGSFKTLIVQAHSLREQLKDDAEAIHELVKDMKETVREMRKLVRSSASPTASPTASPSASPSPEE